MLHWSQNILYCDYECPLHNFRYITFNLQKMLFPKYKYLIMLTMRNFEKYFCMTILTEFQKLYADFYKNKQRFGKIFFCARLPNKCRFFDIQKHKRTTAQIFLRSDSQKTSHSTRNMTPL